MLRISARSVCSEAHAVHALMTGCSFTAVFHRIRLDISSSLPSRFMWSSTSLAGTPQVPDRRAATPCLDVQCANFAPIRRRTRLVSLVCSSDASLSGRNRRLLRGMSSNFLVNQSLLLMTRFAHYNRILAPSPQCSGVVSHELFDVLIAASSVQHRQCWLVLRCDARMRMPLATSRRLRAQPKQSLCQC